MSGKFIGLWEMSSVFIANQVFIPGSPAKENLCLPDAFQVWQIKMSLCVFMACGF